MFVATDGQTLKPVVGLRWRARRILNLCLEIALGLAVVLVARLEQRHNPPPTLGVPWTLFWTFTVLIFAPPLARYLTQWRRPWFWAVAAVLLAIHIAWWTNYIRWWFFGNGGGMLSFPVLVWVLWGLAEYGGIRALFFWRFNPDRQRITLGSFLERGQSETSIDEDFSSRKR